MPKLENPLLSMVLFALLIFIALFATTANAGYTTIGDFENELGNWKWFRETGSVSTPTVNYVANASAPNGAYDLNISKGSNSNVYLIYTVAIDNNANIRFNSQRLTGSSGGTRLFTATAVPSGSNGDNKQAPDFGGIATTDCVVNDPDLQTTAANYITAYSQVYCNFSDGDKYLVLYTGASPNNIDLRYDFVRVETQPTLIINNNTGSTQNALADFNVLVNITNDENGARVTNATVNVNFNSEGSTAMTHAGNGVYYKTFNKIPGIYSYTIDATLTGYKSATQSQGVVEVSRATEAFLKFTPIENIANWKYGSIIITPQDQTKQIIFKVDSNSAGSELVRYSIRNALKDGRQYFVYTASTGDYNAGNWTFNETLTYGSNSNNPIQKIWNRTIYDHNLSDTLLSGQTKYYRLTYDAPFKHYFSIADSSEWFEQLEANPIDVNGILADEYSISSFSNINNYFIQQIPDIFQDSTKSVEFQITAWSDVAGTVLKVGQTVLGTDTTIDLNLSTKPQRYSVTVDATNFDSQLKFKTNNSTSANIYITDYALIPRGYFTKRLKLLQLNGDPLKSILLNNISKQYLQEKSGFRIDTQAYDRLGDLNSITLEAFLDSNTANNKVKKATFPLETGVEKILAFSEIFDGIIDLNGTAITPATPRNVVVKATLQDKNGFSVAEQSQFVTFLQYPYFGTDLIFNFYPTEKRKGKNPAGEFEITMSDIEVLEGFDVRIYSDANSIDSPNYRTILHKGQDFNCQNNKCNFNATFLEYLFEDVNLTTITIFALLQTENLDPNNYLIRVDKRIFVTPIDFKIAKIHQLVERADDKYLNSEEIPLVLALQDTEGSSVREKIDVYLTLQNCDGNSGTPTCVTQTTKFKPTGFMYNDQINVNYYFFRHLFILDNGNLLADGNYVGFRATITDRTGARTAITPVLASKCKNNNFKLIQPIVGLDTFLYGSYKTLIADVHYCTDTTQFDIVSTATNSTQEERLRIQNSKTVASPDFNLFTCLLPTSNRLNDRALTELYGVCNMAYKISEKPIDAFRIRITNPNSDTSLEGSTKQYVEFLLPYELVANNDPLVFKRQLENIQTGARLSTETQLNTIDDLGEALYIAAHYMAAPFLSYLFSALDSYNTFTGILSPSLSIDLNYSTPYTPAAVPAITSMSLEQIPIINIHNYRLDPKLENGFANIPPKLFLETLAQKNIGFAREEPAVLNLLLANGEIVKVQGTGQLVINEEPTTERINALITDSNRLSDIIPVQLKFTFSNTMFYNNFSESITRTDLKVIELEIEDEILVDGKSGTGLNLYPPTKIAEEFKEFTKELSKDPAKAITDFLFENILLLTILIFIFIILAYIAGKTVG